MFRPYILSTRTTALLVAVVIGLTLAATTSLVLAQEDAPHQNFRNDYLAPWRCDDQGHPYTRPEGCTLLVAGKWYSGDARYQKFCAAADMGIEPTSMYDCVAYIIRSPTIMVFPVYSGMKAQVVQNLTCVWVSDAAAVEAAYPSQISDKAFLFKRLEDWLRAVWNME